MPSRFAFIFFAIALLTTATAAQTGAYGPITTQIKAGDVAPDLTVEKTLSSPDSSTWTSANLSGKVTVLSFFPDTTDNLRTVNQWNERVEEFASRPVQFVWITGEKNPSLGSWLAEHPVRGWVLFDPTGATGRAYGQELPQAVIVDRDGRIMGFTSEFVPSTEMLDAALEDRITTTPPISTDSLALARSGLVLLRAEPMRIPRADDSKPNFPPSYEVHVAPSQVVGVWDRSGDKFRSLEGFDLERALSTLYQVSPSRIELAPQIDVSKRYDFTMVVPDWGDAQQMGERMRQGILDHFGLTARMETRPVDVYVLTAPNPKLGSPDPNTGGEMAALTADSGPPSADGPNSSGVGPDSTFPIKNLVGDMSLDGLCQILERNLGRPVVNETNLQGYFHVEVKEDGSKNFPTRLREQAGIIITPAQRNIEFLVVQ